MSAVSPLEVIKSLQLDVVAATRNQIANLILYFTQKHDGIQLIGDLKSEDLFAKLNTGTAPYLVAHSTFDVINGQNKNAGQKVEDVVFKIVTDGLRSVELGVWAEKLETALVETYEAEEEEKGGMSEEEGEDDDDNPDLATRYEKLVQQLQIQKKGAAKQSSTSKQAQATPDVGLKERLMKKYKSVKQSSSTKPLKRKPVPPKTELDIRVVLTTQDEFRHINSTTDGKEMYLHKPCNGKKGFALIIANYHFSNPKDNLSGYEHDGSNASHLFQQLGYTVVYHDNLKTKRMMQAMIDFVDVIENSPADCDSAVVVIMSHGERDSKGNDIIHGTDKGKLKVHKFLAPLYGENCERLKNKPKLVFMQACRGGESHSMVSMEDESKETPTTMPAKPICHTKKEKHDLVASQAHFLIACPTIEGHVSWVEKWSGSWFIQTVCKVFQEHAHNWELQRMMCKVHRIVAEMFSAEESDPKKPHLYTTTHFQACQLRHSLLKQFYFFPGVQDTNKFTE